MSGPVAVDDWVRELADGLAAELRQIVLPRLGKPWSRGLAGRAVGGDTTFAVDAEAEEHVRRRLTGFARPVAYYSEDQGLVSPAGAEWVFIVDPIDGTRPAIAGLEAACVSVAVARLTHNPVMADVCYGAILEIKEGGVFRAVRGGGLEILDACGNRRDVSISGHSDLSRLFWTIGFRGRPAAELVVVLGDLIDRSSVNGGVFDLGSATYTMTRIVTGQLDAYVDVGPLMIERSPWVERRFREVGKGSVLNNCPYDVAAASLILEEAGCVVSDAAGNSLSERPLLGSDVAHQLSVVASANQEMHGVILRVVEEGLERLERMRAT